MTPRKLQPNPQNHDKKHVDLENMTANAYIPL
jgi:hypothetical protein